MNAAQKSGVAILMLSAMGLAACDGSKPSVAGTARQNVDEAAHGAGNAVDHAADKTGQALSNAAEETAETVGDAAVTSKVKTAFLADSGLQSLRIHVATTDGVVTLTGAVDSKANGDKAASIAAGANGVKRVENQLTVNPNG